MRIWCLGNVLLGDDAVGCRIAELLRGRNISGVVECGTTPENHIAELYEQSPAELLIIDAADMGLAPGEFRRLSLEELVAAAAGSHGVPLSLLLSPFRSAFEINALGIQPTTTQLGAPLSETAESAARLVVDLIERGEWKTIHKLSTPS